MNKLKTAFVAAALALAAFVGTASAQAAKPAIAVFDAQQVINGTNAAKRAIADLSSKRNAAQAKIDALEKPLLEKKKQLISQQGVMAADKFQTASADFAKELDGFRSQAVKIQSDLDEQNLKVRKQIAEAVKSAVDSIAKEKGYDVVLPKGVAFYSSANVPDITTDTLARANKLLDK